MTLTTNNYPSGQTNDATGSNVNVHSAATFIPEIWSDEVIASYQSNLVLANLVKKLSMTGKKGDTLHIPKPVRGSANAKVSGSTVNIQADEESEVTVTINKHFEYSRLIEDIAETQALSSLRQFYTGDAGYALAKQVDSDLFELGKQFGNNGGDYVGTGTHYIDSDGTLQQYALNTFDGENDLFTDAGFRALIQKMDDADVPMDGRALVVPPSIRNSIMGIDRYASSDFVDGRVVGNGQIGNLYGIDIFVSSNCPVIEEAGNNSASPTDTKQAMIFHKDAMVLAEQQGVRSQTQYKQDYLSTLYTADTLYGVSVLRNDAAFNLAVSA